MPEPCIVDRECFVNEYGVTVDRKLDIPSFCLDCVFIEIRDKRCRDHQELPYKTGNCDNYSWNEDYWTKL